MLVTCSTCQIEFEKKLAEISEGRNNFCSRSCSAKFNNIGKRRNPPKMRICKECGASFTRSGGHPSVFLCAECLDTYKNRTNYYKSCTLDQYRNLTSVKGKHPSWTNSHVRNFARSWNSALTQIPCQKCGYAAHVELCHIVPISEWPPEATLGEVNSAANLLSLCRNHHWEFDHKHLLLSDIPKRDTII